MDIVFCQLKKRRKERIRGKIPKQTVLLLKEAVKGVG